MLSFAVFRKRFHAESGSIFPLLAVFVLLVLMLGGLVEATARQHRHSASAQWAADVVALAVAAEGVGPSGQATAAELASANGAVIRSITTAPATAFAGEDLVSMVVVVTVDYRGTAATSAAARFIVRAESPPDETSSPPIGGPPG